MKLKPAKGRALRSAHGARAAGQKPQILKPGEEARCLALMSEAQRAGDLLNADRGVRPNQIDCEKLALGQKRPHGRTETRKERLARRLAPK